MFPFNPPFQNFPDQRIMSAWNSCLGLISIWGACNASINHIPGFIILMRLPSGIIIWRIIRRIIIWFFTYFWTNPLDITTIINSVLYDCYEFIIWMHQIEMKLPSIIGLTIHAYMIVWSIFCNKKYSWNILVWCALILYDVQHIKFWN